MRIKIKSTKIAKRLYFALKSAKYISYNLERLQAEVEKIKS